MMFRNLVLVLASATAALSASLQRVTNFGSNPAGIQMNIYVPDRVASNPAVIVAVCFPH